MAIANSAGITAMLNNPASHILQEGIAVSAKSMTILEYGRKLDWENGPMDWETLCVRVANEIESGAEAKTLTPKKILGLYNGD